MVYIDIGRVASREVGKSVLRIKTMKIKIRDMKRSDNFMWDMKRNDLGFVIWREVTSDLS